MSIINPSSPWFRGFISLTIFSFVMSLGMSLSIAGLRDYWQQSGRIVRTLLATVVLPPLLLAALILAVPIPKPVPIALALLAASPCPPFLTQRASQAGASREVALSVQVTLALVSIVTTPIIVSLFQRGFPNATNIRFDPWDVVKMVALVQFLPLGIGFALHQIRAGWVGNSRKFSMS
ncbi:MAG: Na+-dependent transporter, partial [Chloroflexaceae bacterium]|nr:Na+-dependent transporter [Chloroflexaceae bacterium]